MTYPNPENALEDNKFQNRRKDMKFKLYQDVFVKGFVGMITGITHDEQVLWILFPGSMCAEPYLVSDIGR